VASEASGVANRNLQITLKSRPQGWVRESDFAFVR